MSPTCPVIEVAPLPPNECLQRNFAVYLAISDLNGYYTPGLPEFHYPEAMETALQLSPGQLLLVVAPRNLGRQLNGSLIVRLTLTEWDFRAFGQAKNKPP
jgi:hypothetical protein